VIGFQVEWNTDTSFTICGDCPFLSGAKVNCVIIRFARGSEKRDDDILHA
jgi:hypothetical protein